MAKAVFDLGTIRFISIGNGDALALSTELHNDWKQAKKYKTLMTLGTDKGAKLVNPDQIKTIEIFEDD